MYSLSFNFLLQSEHDFSLVASYEAIEAVSPPYDRLPLSGKLIG